MARMLSCLRGFLLGFVVVLGFSGAIVATGSGVFLYQLHEYSLLTPTGVDGPPATLLGLGLLTCVLAWFIWQFDYSSKSQVISLAALITIVGLIEAGVGIWALVRHQETYKLPDKLVQKAVVALNDPKSEDIWHRMHVRLNCCGVNGASEDFRQHHKHVPWSCCYEPTEVEDDRKKCERGCLHPMIHRTQSTLLYVFLLALGSVVLKACIVSVAWCYAKAIMEGMERRRKEITTAAAAAARASSIEEQRNSANLSPLVEKSRMRTP
ncbi:uncharacterized protein LOC100678969 isoform X2 [Nasonia vitripennis]|uniref:Tetraspanin n=1 Tax=Nasonia vitripennis TaxID=7425 RepID=A0A7M7TAR5_NASVI|nr:uncharacterized protein LOC100678969 isoform X2 [Nasonia vitripennis]